MNENGKNLDELVELLLNHDVDVDNKWKRCGAAHDLGEFKDERAVQALIKGIEDYESDVRFAAQKALIKIGEFAVEQLIKQGLKYEDSFVSSGVASALGEIGDLRAVKPLIQALNGKYSWLRWRAAEALGKLGDNRAIEPLEQLLQNEKREEVIEAVEKALEQLKQK